VTVTLRLHRNEVLGFDRDSVRRRLKHDRCGSRVVSSLGGHACDAVYQVKETITHSRIDLWSHQTPPPAAQFRPALLRDRMFKISIGYVAKWAFR
jgi:hypothetical protein